jgi:hypothetical protein
MITMRPTFPCLLMAFCLVNTGCSLVESTCRNVAQQPAYVVDEKATKKHNELVAQDAWKQFAAANCAGEDQAEYTSEYRQGFIEGYADYLTNGGKGEAPAVPPFGYTKLHAQTPWGAMAAQDWFAGFREGALMAMQSGRREYITIPFSIPLTGNLYKKSYASLPRHSEEPALEELPMPKLVPQDQEKDMPQLPPPALLPAQPPGSAEISLPPSPGAGASSRSPYRLMLGNVTEENGSGQPRP